MTLHADAGAHTETNRRLAQIELLLLLILQKVANMTPELQALTDQVAKNTALEASAVELIKGLASQISAVATDPTAVQALASQLSSSAATLAAAIAANTPAAPAPAPAAPTAPSTP